MILMYILTRTKTPVLSSVTTGKQPNGKGIHSELRNRTSVLNYKHTKGIRVAKS
jgi:hypothetical protein